MHFYQICQIVRALEEKGLLADPIAAKEVLTKTFQDEINLTWCTEDVKDISPNLTHEEAREVLEEVRRRHDASLGVNWDALRETAHYMFPDKHKGLQEEDS